MILPSNGKQNEHFLYHQHGSLHENQLKILDIARNKVMSISPQNSSPQILHCVNIHFLLPNDWSMRFCGNSALM